MWEARGGESRTTAFCHWVGVTAFPDLALGSTSPSATMVGVFQLAEQALNLGRTSHCLARAVGPAGASTPWPDAGQPRRVNRNSKASQAKRGKRDSAVSMSPVPQTSDQWGGRVSSVISAEARGASTQSGAGGGQLGGGCGSGDTPSPLVEHSCGLGFGPWREGAGRGVWLLRGWGRGVLLVQRETS